MSHSIALKIGHIVAGWQVKFHKGLREERKMECISVNLDELYAKSCIKLAGNKIFKARK